MDELTLVRELGRETPLPEAARLAQARARLLAAVAAEPPAAKNHRRLGVRPYLPVLGWAATGVAAVVVAVTVIPSARPPVSPPADQTLAGLAPGASWSMRPAAQVLDLAAQTASMRPDVVPRADQFVYVRTILDGEIGESWRSVDGEHDGLTVSTSYGHTERTPVPGCRSGRQINTGDGGKVVVENCEPSPAYEPGVPTDVDGMLRYLRARNVNDSAESVANSTAKDIWEMSEGMYLRPAQRAALLRAAAQVPGLRVVEGATDAIGRRGTGIAWTYLGTSAIWIFDPTTYTYLGTPTTVSSQSIVDRVGQRP